MKEVIPASLDGERVDRVIATMTGLPRTVVARMIEASNVMLNAKPAKSRGQKVVEGQIIEFELPDEESTLPEADDTVVFTVLHSDDHVIVVDKPAGLVVHPGNGHVDQTLVNGLLAKFPDMTTTRPGDSHRPGIVHRLDAGTSGLLVVARTREAYVALVGAMKARQVERHYLTLVWGDVQPDQGVIDAPIGRSERDRTKMAVSGTGRDARTRYEVLQRRKDPELSLVAAQLETGRTHQIRVHFAAIGHPVVGDRRYRGIRQGVEMERPFLHAHSLRFAHPVSGEPMEFESPIPRDLGKVLEQFEFVSSSSRSLSVQPDKG